MTNPPWHGRRPPHPNHTHTLCLVDTRRPEAIGRRTSCLPRDFPVSRRVFRIGYFSLLLAASKNTSIHENTTSTDLSEVGGLRPMANMYTGSRSDATPENPRATSRRMHPAPRLPTRSSKSFRLHRVRVRTRRKPRSDDFSTTPRHLSPTTPRNRPGFEDISRPTTNVLFFNGFLCQAVNG